MNEFTLRLLTESIATNEAALRLCLKLEPIGGTGDKIFPSGRQHHLGCELATTKAFDRAFCRLEDLIRPAFELAWRRVKSDVSLTKDGT